MFFIAYAFKGQVHVFAGPVNIHKSHVLQDKRNIKIFLSPAHHNCKPIDVKTAIVSILASQMTGSFCEKTCLWGLRPFLTDRRSQRN